MRVHHEKEQWGEFAIRKSDGMRVQLEKKRERLRVHHEKERWGESSPQEEGIM